MSVEETPRIWRFGDCEVDEGLFELRRAGRRVPMEPKVFDVLCFLIRHRERVLSKDELLDALWPGESVSESVLPRCVAAARRAVGDDRARQAFVKTVHGRGYRFVADVESPADAPAPLRTAVHPPARPDRRLVGRDGVLERMGEALGDAAAGAGRAVFVVGEPGIGKTRLVEELEGEALRRGFVWLAGRGYEDASAPAFRPWVEALRGLSQEGASATNLSDLLPVPSGEGEPPRDATARYRLFDAVDAALERAASQQPVVIFLDDLHWADGDSLALVEFVVPALRRRPVLFVGAYRDVDVRRGHPLAAVLRGLGREPHCAREALAGLGADEVASLIEETAGAAASAPVVEAVSALTGGNPFFVLEMAQLLAEEGALEGEGTALSWSLPQGIRDAIGRRLDSLSPECVEVLRIAAVLGDEFSIAHLASLEGDAGETLLELLGEASAAHVLDDARSRGRLAFRHALIRRTLLEELGVAQRIALHRRAAEMLEAAYGDEVAMHAAELAHHWFECAAAGHAAAAVSWSVRAAQHASVQRAYDDAARHMERALEAVDLLVPSAQARRGELLLELGALRVANAERARARAAYRDAAAVARELDRSDLLGSAAVGFAGVAEMGAPPDPEKQDLLEEALARLGPEDAALRAQVLSRLSGMGSYAPRRSDRETISREALTLARRSGDAEAIADALAARSWAALGIDGIAQRLDVSSKIEASALERGDLRAMLWVHEGRVSAALYHGDVGAAQREVDVYFERATRLRQSVFLFLGHLMQAGVAMSAGDYPRAQAALDACVGVDDDVLPYAAFLRAGTHARLALMRGARTRPRVEEEQIGARVGALFPALQRLIECGLAQDELARGGAAEASSRLHRLIEGDAHGPAGFEGPVESWEHDEHWAFSLELVTPLVCALGAAPEARRIEALLAPYAGLAACHDLMRVVGRSIDSLRGDLLVCAGDPEQALARYDAALAFEAGGGLRSALRVSQVHAARVLAEGDPAARERGEALLAQAAALSTELVGEGFDLSLL